MPGCKRSARLTLVCARAWGDNIHAWGGQCVWRQGPDLAGWSVGFLAGRMSAWLIPVDQAGAVQKKRPSQVFETAQPAKAPQPANEGDGR